MTCYPPSGYIIISLRKLKFYRGWGMDRRTGGRGLDNPPINSANPYNEVSKSTYCPLIAKHNDRNYYIFVLHHISFASVSTGGLCLYQLL